MESFINRLGVICAKMKKGAKENSLFTPEWQAVERIIELLNSEELAEPDLATITEVYNVAHAQNHYDGTAWFDVYLHLRGIAELHGQELIQRRDRSLLLLSKD